MVRNILIAVDPDRRAGALRLLALAGELRRCLGASLTVATVLTDWSLVARAGVAVYRVGAVKKRGSKTWLLVDGGMADNPRFALYGARYSCLPVTGLRRERTESVSIAGPFCESGDILIENLPMPDIQVAGAYQLSRASNYNGARRPAVLMLENGEAKLILRRETVEDLLRREL